MTCGFVVHCKREMRDGAHLNSSGLFHLVGEKHRC